MARILIVEDEPSMRMGLKDNLEFESFDVDQAPDGEEGLEKSLSNTYDLILLDVMMPKMSGLDMCKALRSKGNKTPIIFLTAKGEEIDKVLGLELGADDYITKPFSLREVIARVKAVLRRAGALAPEKSPRQFTIGKLWVDFEHYEAKIDNKIEKLSHKEFEVLLYLHKHKNEVVSRYQLLEDVWGYETQPTTRTIDNFILKLRHRIEENPNNPRHILTVHGAGYKLLVS